MVLYFLKVQKQIRFMDLKWTFFKHTLRVVQSECVHQLLRKARGQARGAPRTRYSPSPRIARPHRQIPPTQATLRQMPPVPSSFLPRPRLPAPAPPRLSPPQTLHLGPRPSAFAVPDSPPPNPTAQRRRRTGPCRAVGRADGHPPRRRRPPPPPLMSPTCDLGFLWPRSQKSSQEVVPLGAASCAQRLASPPQPR